MKSASLCLIALSWSVACDKPTPPPRADSIAIAASLPASLCASTAINGEGIGFLRIGVPVSDIRKSCHVLRDTVELADEGLPSRILTVDMGRDTLAAEVDSGRIWRIRVSQARFQTSDSLRVGTAIARLLTLPGVQGWVGENALYVVAPSRCGLSFRVTDPAEAAPKEEWTLADLRTLPSSTRVTEILIVGCRPAA